MTTPMDFVVSRSDLRRCAFVPAQQGPETPLGAGQVLLRIDRFAFTSNNVTYGAVGEMIGYWNFFPAAEGWGRLPVWGFADAVRTAHDAVPVGERLYGYFPISGHLLIQADRVSPAALIDASAHRAALPPIYNQYTRVAADPAYDPRHEPQVAIFRPLFATSFLLDDFLASSGFFDARRVVLTSASSKTALGLAHLLAETRRGQCRVVGLTSGRNAAFVERTGYYDGVVTYDDLGALPADLPTVVVDFAGNGTLTRGVHERLGDCLRYDCAVGITHWEKMAPPEALPGPAPVFFFAPDHAKRRMADWGPAGFYERVGTAMRTFIVSSARWLRVIEGHGQEAVEAVYRSMLEGRSDPAEGHLLSLWPRAAT